MFNAVGSSSGQLGLHLLGQGLGRDWVFTTCQTIPTLGSKLKSFVDNTIISIYRPENLAGIKFGGLASETEN